jgi:hypothetical protein
MKFKTGDRVQIVNYGQAIWDEKGMTDIQPQLVGKKGTISEATESQPGYERYSLDVDNYGYIAWFGTAQLMRL